MILSMFAVFDKAVQAYLPPLTFRHVGEAKRAFQAACVQGGALAAHRSDYSLCRIGSFDDSTGLLVPISTGVEVVMNGLEVTSVEPVEFEKQ